MNAATRAESKDCPQYYPDFIEHLILETKGRDNELARSKRAYLREWVEAVNNHGGFNPCRPPCGGVD